MYYLITDVKHSPSMLPPKVREAMKLSRPEEFQKVPGRVCNCLVLINNPQNNI